MSTNTTDKPKSGFKSTYKCKETIEGQLTDLGEVVRDLATEYYKRNGYPMLYSSIINNRMKFIAPLATMPQAKKWIESAGYVTIAMNTKGHLYALPPNIDKDDLAQAMWNLESLKAMKRKMKHDATW